MEKMKIHSDGLNNHPQNSANRNLIFFLILFLTINTTFSFAQTRTVTFTGADSNYSTKDNVTVAETATNGNYTINCVNSSQQSYLRFNGTTEHIKFTLSNPSEKIDSVRYIWRANAVDHHFIFMYGSAITLGTYLGSGDAWQVQNGGWSRSISLSAIGNTNCPGTTLKFPNSTIVSSIVMCRRIVINDTSYPENNNLETLYARMNNTTNANYPTAYGSSSTIAIGQVILYISEIQTCTTPTNYTVSGSTVICSGPTNVTLSGSQNGVTYALYKDAVLVASSATAGTGNALNWSVNESGTYTIKTTTAGGYCETTMSGSAIISIDNTGPAIIESNLSGASYEQNATATALSISATAANAYQWYSNSTASNVGGTLINEATNASYTPLTTTLGTYYYYVVVSGPCGEPVTSNVSGAINVITPSPTITLTSAANTQHQSRKAGTAINNITYTIANATGATVSTLPAGLSGNYSDGTFTISGTIDNAADLAIVNFTVTATALSGYVGEPITATGSISVKSPTAKEILYLNDAATVHANDTQIFPNINNNVNYLVTIKQAASTAPTSAAYDNYDLIIVSESVGSSNAELIALKNINKPILNFKSFAYGTGRWSWGTGNDVNNNGTINIKQPNHPVFNNITLNDGSLELLSNTNGKAILSADVNLAGSINVALGTKTSGYGVAIHDVPANIRGVASAKHLLLSISIDSYDKVTPAGLTLINNAIDYLLNGTQFEAEPLQYRTSGSGNLSALSWESSYDGTNWSADVQRPQTGNNSLVRASAGSAININSDIEMEELVIEATATVNVLPTQKLTLTQGVNNAGSLRLQSNSSGTATILMPASANSGNAIVEQYLPQGRNWYVGTPVQTSNAGILTAVDLGSTVSHYNEATAAWVNNYSGALTPGKGYVSVSSAGSSTANAAFEGTLNNGEIVVELTRKGATKAGFNLIANPYPSYLNAMLAINANSNVEPTIWYRTRSSAYHFETVNTASGVGTNVSGQGLVTGYIPPMQAFWVRTTADEQSITFNNNMRHHASPLVGETTVATTPLRAKAASNTIIRLQIDNTINTDELVLYTHDAAQNAFDKFDSQKMSNDNPTIAEIYSIVDGRQLAINGLNEINSASTIALGIKANAGNNLRIGVSQLQHLPANCDLILFDKLLQTEHVLTENSHYAFEHINNTQRFDLIFRAKGVTTNLGENNAKTLVYVNSNKQIVISNNSQSKWANVYNLAGQIVHSELLSNTTTALQANFKPGIYIVAIENMKQKIVIE